ncbi:MAG: DNA gyrase subunit A [Candidatus Pacebacteria bacterium]|nr:DNA gyrase subunit A [Candidatus Paceibacterota bacterium]
MAEEKQTPEQEQETQSQSEKDQAGQAGNGNGKIGTIEETDYGRVKHISIVNEMEKSYLDYAMSVIVSRALPDVRDGLKPVHRRILYSMYRTGIRHNSAYKKSARIVGDVLGKYHPHGDNPVYMALVRLAQNFSMRYPLVDGQGNFGSIDGDSPAAMRYTEARLAKISQELLEDLKKGTVKFRENFDGSLEEPVVLPGKLPNLLLMGAEGIAVGMATKIPPHNLTEVCQAIEAMIKAGKSEITDEQKKINQEYKKDLKPEELAALVERLLDRDGKQIAGQFSSNITIDEITEHVQGPDFPTAGIIYDFESIKKAYQKGKGKIVIRARTEIVETSGGGYEIVVTEIPYQVNKARLIRKIADLVKNDKVDGIRNIRDDSDRQGLQITIELKRGTRPKVILNKLFKYSNLQTSYPMNMVALNSEGTPQLMNIKQVLSEYVRHRQVVVVRRSQHELTEARDRAHILEGLLIALDNLDEVIETIRNSADTQVAHEQLMKKFKLSDPQATAILEMQLKRLAALERQKIIDEYEEIKKTINKLAKLLTHPKQILKVIVDEIQELIANYGDDRRTQLVKSKIGEFSETDLIPNQPTVITLTKQNYIKRLGTSALRAQARGGKGVILKMKEEDVIDSLITCSTHDSLLFFTNQGRVFKMKAFEIPEMSRQAKGTAIVNLLSLQQNEDVQSVLTVDEKKDQDKFITLATKEGLVKKSAVNLYENIRSTGIIAITLNDGDEVVQGQITSGQDELFLTTKQGKCIRFSEEEVKDSSRDTKGVKGITLKKDDYVVAFEAITQQVKKDDQAAVLVVTEGGMGKRTLIEEYPSQKRSGLGVKVAEVTKRTGLIAASRIVTSDHKELVISTKNGQTIKLPNTKKSIPFLTRPTQGVILIKLKKGDRVVTIALTQEQE